MITALLAALALPAAAQSPMPYSNEAASPAPAVSTAPAVAASTAAVAASTAAVKAVSAPKAKPARPIRAVIHPDGKDWKPLSIKAGGDPRRIETKVVLRQKKVKGKYKGTPSKAKVGARLHKDREDRWLVVSIFPAALEKRRMHLEVRLKIVEGFVEVAKAAAVSIVDRRPGAGAGLDSFELRAQGVAFEEESPASGSLVIAALDPRPSKAAVNSGALKLAAFGAHDVGLADASWFVKGLLPPK